MKLEKENRIIEEKDNVFIYYCINTYGKYLFFSTNKKRLIEIAQDEILNHGFSHAKIGYETTIDRYTNLPTYLLCLYYRDDSRFDELEDRYISELNEIGYDNFRLVKFKTDEETMEPFNRIREAMDKRADNEPNNILTKEDSLNISKWMTSASMMVEGGLRIPFSESERKTWDKVKNVK